MNTQDNLNLDVEYLEVVTCTYSELSKIKKPTNGRLYHTSDTNEFYFDWNNKRHKLSVFTTDKSESSDVVKKSELGAWLKENNYITNLSLTDALVDVIGSPIENIITKQALENYSKNYLLTKEELNLLNKPLNLIEDIKTLKGTNETLFSYCEGLANKINEVRTIANDKISSGELDTRLNDYIKKSLADSLYLSKDAAGELYIDEEEFVEKLKGYVTNEQLTKSLKPYQKVSEADLKYATKSDSDNKYLQKSVASKTYATKSEVSNTYETKEGVDEKLSGYVKQEDTADFAKKSDVESSYVRKEELGKYETKSNAGNRLSTFAKMDWVNEYFTQKTDLKRILNDYATKEYVANQLSIYTTNESVDDKISQTNRQIIDTNNKFANYATKSQLQSVIDTIPSKGEISSTYVTKDELNTRISNLESYSNVDEKLKGYVTKEELNGKETSIKNEIVGVKNKLSDYATKSQLQTKLEKYITKSVADSTYLTTQKLNDRLSDYEKSSDVDAKLNGLATKEYVDDKISGVSGEIVGVKNKLSDYVTKSQLQTKLEGYITKSESKSSFVTPQVLNDKLSVYEKTSDVDEKLNEYTKNEEFARRLKEYLTKTQISDTYVSKGSLKDYVKKSDVDFETFAKKIWVDEYYMKKFKLSDYLKADDIFEIFLQKSVADEVYLKKNDAEKTYAKIVDIIGLATSDAVTREESKVFAKKVWVDEYFVRKGQIDGIQNATVLSREFETESDLKNSEKNIKQGFYYLTSDQVLMVAIDDGNGGKMFINITNLEAGFALYFGGDDVNW